MYETHSCIYIKTLQQVQSLNVSITANDSIGTNSIGTMHIYIYVYDNNIG